ncbi:prolyl oligopeptidase family serine peptidase [Endozoicomonas arenosclerae]|uniref:prolyl oligopeptidase family serine peptidase n=1 Tax=Endozoicomonas arenosclerae TaxID=1633495 RepID=UPI0009A1E4CD|nr:prolyl oligopeptidase family serine peptidase [Endozoicomonas arenosclerae]
MTVSRDTSEPILVYPKTRKDDTIDQYFGVEVSDSYRWLEDDLSDETAEWVRTQNTATQAYLKQIPYRDKIQSTLKELMDFEKVLTPFVEGGVTYFFRNEGLQNQFVLYRQKDGTEPEVFLDPNTFSEDGTTSLAGISFSKSGKLTAFQQSEAGSDWTTIHIMDCESGEMLEPPLKDIKFSDASWLGDEGFFYSSYDKPDGSELSAKTDQHKLYFHKLGTPQSEDRVIYGASESEKHRYVGGDVTEDDRYLMVSAQESTSGNRLYLKDLSDKDSTLVAIVDHLDSDTHLLDSDEQFLYLQSNSNSPNQRVVKVAVDNPGEENWVDLIPETEHTLDAFSGAGFIFAHYMVDAVSKVFQYDFEGKQIREITLPDLGSADGFSGKSKQKTLYFSFTNFKTPGRVYSLDPVSGESSVYKIPDCAFDSDQYVSRQVFYTSKDGTKVPMTINHHKDLKLDGNTPTLLYGYGGFDVSLTPYYSSAIAAWLSLGGVYVVANLRGGGEYGKKWHLAGTKLQKQNVFDDFIAAAEYLIDEKYTSSNHLAIFGGSNGGLLVGACMTQRPDLFKVALPAVGVLDMLRYHKFTSGAGWAYDYGTSEDNAEMFEYLHGYSPLHNIREGVEYPATMVTTGDHDDRVVPAHSFKFAAELQSKQSGSNPALIRIETNAGHGAGKPTSKMIEEYADIYGFALFNMGVETLN